VPSFKEIWQQHFYNSFSSGPGFASRLAGQFLSMGTTKTAATVS
jgi:hypothetical protein